MTTPRVFSYGGGTQSTAALVLAARGEIDFSTFVFANVGEDSENPATLDYVRDFAIPYADAHGLELIERRKITRDKKPQTLIQMIDRQKRSIPIPVRMIDGAPGNRKCTFEFKIRVIEKELQRRGATKLERGVAGIGISLEEFARAGSPEDDRSPYLRREYPLLDARITRDQCRSIILDAGLPVPEKSSCYFCPFHRDEEWRRMARLKPELFAKACALEDKLHARGHELGRGDFYFTRHGRPLRDLFDGRETTLFEDDAMDVCESGFCMT